jgi:hypothetical protein
LPDTDAQGASNVALRAIDAVGHLQIPHTELKGLDRIALSMAGACFTSSRAAGGNTDAAALPNDLISAAESALRSARRAGGRQAKVIEIGGQNRVARSQPELMP